MEELHLAPSQEVWDCCLSAWANAIIVPADLSARYNSAMQRMGPGPEDNTAVLGGCGVL